MISSFQNDLAYRQYGANDGHPVIYFHGIPGSAREGEIFDAYGKVHKLSIICYDRSSIDHQLHGIAYYQRIADAISARVADKPVVFVGFSIGAFIALQVCRAMNGKVHALHLISAAAPLDAENFIELMAGKAVFRLAQNNPVSFLLLARLQGFLARYSADFLFARMFSSATGDDKSLLADQVFRRMIKQGLKTGFTHPQAYARDIKAYVHPWKDTLHDITANTTIWHGAEDNWSPVTMATYLASTLPNCSKLEVLDGLSHYSCLYRTAETICLSINKLNWSKNNKKG